MVWMVWEVWFGLGGQFRKGETKVLTTKTKELKVTLELACGKLKIHKDCQYY